MAATNWKLGIDLGSHSLKVVVLDNHNIIQFMKVFLCEGRPMAILHKALEEILNQFPLTQFLAGITGTSGIQINKLLGIEFIQETAAINTAIGRLCPNVRTVIEIGHTNQLFAHLSLRHDRLITKDSSFGTKCASGSGSFLGAMAKRLDYTLSDFALAAINSDAPTSLAGRCAVFTESDIVHQFQRGTPKDRIAAGIHLAVARNFRSAIAKSKKTAGETIFLGGVAENPAVLKYLQGVFDNPNIFVPDSYRYFSAIGTALKANKAINLTQIISNLFNQINQPFNYEPTGALRQITSEPTNVLNTLETEQVIEVAGLGIDIGSVSTKAALVTYIDNKLVVLAHHYRWTEGNPIAAVKDVVAKICLELSKKQIKVRKIIAGTTGSGRYLTGDLIGADLIVNEITAQASGAHALDPAVDTILEIGGQDSKVIFVNQDGQITGFEMNKACAAGTGAFLFKQAELLGIDKYELGELALQGNAPPVIDATCTIFAENTILYYKANNVPVENLAAGICLASVKNFLAKTLGNRSLGQKITFQGAVAFNRGMVAAFETLLARPITVSEIPHITGAIGIARLAYLENCAVSQFHGFNEIEASDYSLDSFECQACENRCDVNCFRLGEQKFFYGDRCEKFSGKRLSKKVINLPNLFEEREALLMESYVNTNPNDSPAIGVPRGLMFSEYYPLYAAFLGELGFRVQVSDPTNNAMIKIGSDLTLGDPCFPFKVAHAHYDNLVNKGIKRIFAPRIISTEQPDQGFQFAQTCPYLQAAPDQIGAALNLKTKGIEIIAPDLHFIRGTKHIKQQFMKTAVKLGKSKAQGRNAYRKAATCLTAFRNKIKARANEVLAEIPENTLCFVVIGRPYTLWDEAINMKVAQHILELGVLALPQDYLPLEDAEISGDWGMLYSRQIQKKIAAARLIRQDVRMRAIVLSYFGCGPDSFANQFFTKELGESCYIMTLDEHTSATGVITRLEAFHDSIRFGKKEVKPVLARPEPDIASLKTKRIWIPNVNAGSRMLAASMRAYGLDAQVLPPSPDSGLSLARHHITEDVCLPAFVTTEDMLWRTKQPDFQPAREAFFQGNSNGPCRFGMYSPLQRQILDSLGFTNTEIVSLGIRSADGGLGLGFAVTAWNALVTSDLITRMLHKIRPYEINKGEAESIYELLISELENLKPETSLTDFKGHIRSAVELFSNIKTNPLPKPIIGLVGEFYVRLSSRANQDVIGVLESLGAEVWLAPMTEFFSYANYLAMVLAKDRLSEGLFTGTNFKEFLGRSINHWLATRNEHELAHAAAPLLHGFEDISSPEVVELGKLYIDYNFGGEAICSMGKAEDFARRGLAGVVSVIPFNCMPGNIVSALSQTLRERHDDLPFITLNYDGFIDPRREAQLAGFMSQVYERVNED
jgi:predicted CoA-substrate-specific enzyme activase